jgi:hypothetical protein
MTGQSQPGQIVCETLSQKTFHKNMAGAVAKSESLSSSPSTAKKKKKSNVPVYSNFKIQRSHPSIVSKDRK